MRTRTHTHTRRIVVSAPNATASGAQVDNTGVVYTCPILPGECSPLLGDSQGADRRLYDTDGMLPDFMVRVGCEYCVWQLLGLYMYV